MAENRYPEGATVGQKRTIRRKAAKSEVRDGELFYKKTMKDEIRRNKAEGQGHGNDTSLLHLQNDTVTKGDNDRVFAM